MTYKQWSLKSRWSTSASRPNDDLLYGSSASAVTCSQYGWHDPSVAARAAEAASLEQQPSVHPWFAPPDSAAAAVGQQGVEEVGQGQEGKGGHCAWPGVSCEVAGGVVAGVRGPAGHLMLCARHLGICCRPPGLQESETVSGIITRSSCKRLKSI